MSTLDSIYKARPKDTEDRDRWYIWSRMVERYFVMYRAPSADIIAHINPEKASSPHAIDLVVAVPGKGVRLTELKPQFVPLFKANELFGLDPEYAISVNVNDIYEYADSPRDFDVIYWIEWLEPNITIRGVKYSVETLGGIWISSKYELIEAGLKAINVGNILTYRRRRIGDLASKINSRESCVLDVRSFSRVEDYYGKIPYSQKS